MVDTRTTPSVTVTVSGKTSGSIDPGLVIVLQIITRGTQRPARVLKGTLTEHHVHRVLVEGLVVHQHVLQLPHRSTVALHRGRRVVAMLGRRDPVRHSVALVAPERHVSAVTGAEFQTVPDTERSREVAHELMAPVLADGQLHRHQRVGHLVEACTRDVHQLSVVAIHGNILVGVVLAVFLDLVLSLLASHVGSDDRGQCEGRADLVTPL